MWIPILEMQSDELTTNFHVTRDSLRTLKSGHYQIGVARLACLSYRRLSAILQPDLDSLAVLAEIKRTS